MRLVQAAQSNTSADLQHRAQHHDLWKALRPPGSRALHFLRDHELAPFTPCAHDADTTTTWLGCTTAHYPESKLSTGSAFGTGATASAAMLGRASRSVPDLTHAGRERRAL